MKEADFIATIRKTVTGDFIGDDCAYLKDLELVMTQDSLVEDVHFKRDYTTAFQLGYKAVAVNISDVYAAGAIPKYISLALSLPASLDEKFIKEFYEGAQAASDTAQIVGGDITGADKIFISICALGSAKGRKISSRKSAKVGDKIIVAGNFGSSAAGLKLLQEGKYMPERLIKSHLEPTLQKNFSAQIAQNATEDYAMTDSSDGLYQSLLQIAQESKVAMSIDSDKIPYDKSIEIFEDYKDLILFGGEDYSLVATVSSSSLNKLTNCLVIGEVIKGKDVIIDNKKIIKNKTFNHFGES